MIRDLVGIGRKFGRLYGLPERGQTDISSLLKVQCESLIPAAQPCSILGRSAGRNVAIPARSLTEHGLLRTQ
jgi:hypothetical protein